MGYSGRRTENFSRLMGSGGVSGLSVNVGFRYSAVIHGPARQWDGSSNRSSRVLSVSFPLIVSPLVAVAGRLAAVQGERHALDGRDVIEGALGDKPGP